jgi:Ca2+-binding EF-hand superfamily protein
MSAKLKEVDVQEEIIEAFRVFDKERTGYVGIDEVKKVLTKMGDGVLSKDEVNEILRELDPEGT